MNHTPGPWCVEHLPDDGPSIHTDEAGIARRIAGVDMGGWRKTSRKEAEANARLIAAAPELLEALRDLLSLHPGTENKWTQQAQAAIAKAEGRS